MKKLIIGLLASVVFLVGMVCLPHLRAQSAAYRPENRVLLIFDTSSDMKKRLPSEVKSVKRLFAFSLAEQLRRGDSVGVWTFARDLQTGEMPLQHWEPIEITDIASNIILFVESRHYSKSTSFSNLVPVLNRVISGSGRLTTLIFCDGETPISGTVYDNSINDIFKQHRREMEKIREPFVIVLRSEDGQFISSSINAAESVDLPPFPEPAAPAPAPLPPAPLPPAPAPAPAPTVPPLIIIDHPKPAPPVPVEAAPPAPAPANAVPARPPSLPPQSVNSIVPNHPPTETASAPPATVTVARTNVAVTVPSAPHNPPVATATTATAPVPENSGINKTTLLAIGIATLLVTGISTVLTMRRSRRRGTESLITQSLKNR